MGRIHADAEICEFLIAEIRSLVALGAFPFALEKVVSGFRFLRPDLSPAASRSKAELPDTIVR